MKISTKGRYGLRIMLDLAVNSTDEPRMVADICKSQSLSPKYASRLILKLRDAGIISAVRGAKGGYRLRRLPKHISLLEIIEAMEGEISIVDCIACPNKCPLSPKCAAKNVWRKLNAKIRSDIQAISLQDVLNMREESADYCI